MRRRFRTHWPAGALLAALSIALFTPSATATRDNWIVLRVNNRIATALDYERRTQARLDELRQASMPEPERQRLAARVGDDVMREMLEELLLLSRADLLGIEVTEEDVSEAVTAMLERLGVSGEAEYEQMLESTGMTDDALRQLISEELMASRVLRLEVRPRIQLDEEDLRRYYQAHPEEFRVPARIRVREIVLLDSAVGYDPRRLADVATDLGRCLIESDFELDSCLASDETGEALADLRRQGAFTGWVDLGWVQQGDLDEVLEEASRELSVGALSAPLLARGGVHLLQVLERRDLELQSFAEVKDRILEREDRRVFEDEMTRYLKELEEQSYVVVNPPAEATGFRTSADVDEPARTARASPDSPRTDRLLPAEAYAGADRANPPSSDSPLRSAQQTVAGAEPAPRATEPVDEQVSGPSTAALERLMRAASRGAAIYSVIDAGDCPVLRLEPDDDAESLDCLQPGTVGAMTGIAADWVRLLLADGREGWVADSALRRSSLDGTAPDR